MYCEFSSVEADEKGLYMRCQKDCVCSSTDVQYDSKPSTALYFVIGIGLCLLVGTIFALVDTVSHFNNLMSH